MRITHLGHAAVLAETDDARILIDPGNFSDSWHSLTDLDAVLVTHQHPDHLDPEDLPSLLDANPSTAVLVEPSILDLINGGKLPSLGGTAAALPPDDQVAIGALEGFPNHDELLSDRGRTLAVNRLNEMTNTRVVNLR